MNQIARRLQQGVASSTDGAAQVVEVSATLDDEGVARFDLAGPRGARSHQQRVPEKNGRERKRNGTGVGGHDGRL